MGILRDNRGSGAVIVIMSILSVLTLLFAYSLKNIYQHNRLIDYLDRRETARQLAEAGLEVAKDRIYHSPNANREVLRIEGELHRGSFVVNIMKLEDSSGFEAVSTGKSSNFEVTLTELVLLLPVSF